MQDSNTTLESAVAELAGAVETCLGAETMDQIRPTLMEINTAIDDLIVGIDQAKDTRKVAEVPVREAMTMMKETLTACVTTTEPEGTKRALREVLEALRQMNQVLSV